MNADKKNKKKRSDRCSICGKKIRTMAFIGTGVCGENHRKERAKEVDPT